MSTINDYEYYNERFDFWENVYGYKMKIMKQLHFREIVFDYIDE